ncbi:methyl-accepting chemotaxis protein McpA [Clostridium acetireducens DSM 10703]|uniref:Methyl-accepting chemotaxis protein McpA n=1 Tax=Clostridium acetireducens DSM 10703 TaxID=1121290 RepID=A0A1E8F002_9CLOT|nr:methyl-accepting chemotaxis protein [Clostridium acetireducens]OFI06717.1 methyl-accepting chemotaxis protein McpA [Clostridium acetireducens DSM 10703]
MKFKFNLKSKLQFYFIILTIIPLIIFGVSQYYNTKIVLQEIEEKKVLSILDTNTKEFKSSLNNVEENSYIISQMYSIKSFCDYSEKGQIDDNIRKNAQYVIDNIKSSMEYKYDSIIIYDKKGNAILSSKDNIKHEKNTYSNKYFMEALKGKRVWGELNAEKDLEEQIVPLYTPIKGNNGDIKAVITVNVNFSTLIKNIKNIKIEKSGYAYIVDNEGKIIYHPKSINISNENSINDNKELHKQIAYMAEYKEGKGFYKIDGIKKFNAYKPIENWSIAINVPVNEYMNPVYKIRNTCILMIIIFIIISFILSIRISKKITKPIKKLMLLMKKAEKGDFSVQAVKETEDEIGDLVVSFNNMIEGQKQVIKTILEVSEELGASSEEASSASEEMAANAENQNASMEELTNSINDMNISINEVTDKITKMANNINHINGNMDGIGTNVKEVSEDILGTFKKFSHISKSIEKMTASIESVYKDSQNASKDAKETVYITEEGGKKINNIVDEIDKINISVTELTNTIKNLGKAALEIEDIVEVIDDIAEQTNLLSLNASIEAARAGEYGKGFAVVASAIGDLAEKSSESTKNVENIIKHMQNQVEDSIETTDKAVEKVKSGISLVKSTEKVLENIYNSVESTAELMIHINEETKIQAETSENIKNSIINANEIAVKVYGSLQEETKDIEVSVSKINELNDLSQEIASSSEEQAASSNEISIIANNVGDMANEVTSASEQVALTAENLAKGANKLVKIADNFKLQ